MKSSTFVILGLTAVGLALFATYSSNVQDAQFQEFMQTYGVNYHDTNEYNFRLETFKANMKKIEEVAARNPKAEFGITRFVDRTPQEYKAMLNYNRAVNYDDPCAETKATGTPSTVDWTGLMGEIQDQASCGGCWAFATVAVSEGRYALSQGQKEVTRRFSPQQLIDCDDRNSGCGGGFEAWAFDFFTKHDLCDAKDYPYTARDGKCKGECSTGIRIKTCSKIPQDDNKAAVHELANGPMDVAIDATDIMGYKSGIMESCNNYGLDHAVTLVGYNSNDDGEETVTIRNSWGASWGEQGDFRLTYNGHLCGWDEDAHSITF